MTPSIAGWILSPTPGIHCNLAHWSSNLSRAGLIKSVILDFSAVGSLSTISFMPPSLPLISVSLGTATSAEAASLIPDRVSVSDLMLLVTSVLTLATSEVGVCPGRKKYHKIKARATTAARGNSHFRKDEPAAA